MGYNRKRVCPLASRFTRGSASTSEAGTTVSICLMVFALVSAFLVAALWLNLWLTSGRAD